MPIGIDPRDVKPGSSGMLFLVERGKDGEGNPLYTARFQRVRVMLSNVNMADMGEAERLAKQLQADGFPYLAFAAGRNTPLPESGVDVKDFEALASFGGSKQ